ncbi:hypothetical protein [Aquabacterium sp.]|uniref:hypothetical protein n=1 Tax=Aquabacterium sp. TaxID=1872578 RepID=UPI0035AEC05B
MQPTDRSQEPADPWSEATQLATEIMDHSASEASEGRDLGKKVSEHVRELFVVCDPAEALRQHFELGVTPFLALHDLGTGKSRDYLAALSQASGWPLRRLHIRRQGFGTTLASLHYIDCPAQNQRALRIYASDAEAESGVRIAIRRQLLASAMSNALLAEELPEQVATLAYACLRDDLLSRHGAGVSMLVLPQARSPRLQQDVQALQHVGGAHIEVAPATNAITAGWALLASYWNREAAQMSMPQVPMIARINLGPTPMPVVSRPAAPARPVAAPAQPQPLSAAEYLTLVAGRTEALGACIFNVATRAIEAHGGSVPANDLAQQAHALLMAVARAGDALALGRMVSETTATVGDAQLVIRPIRVRPGCALVLLLPRTAGADAWRRELEQIDAAMT